jgi:hypothetical protein
MPKQICNKLAMPFANKKGSYFSWFYFLMLGNYYYCLLGVLIYVEKVEAWLDRFLNIKSIPNILAYYDYDLWLISANFSLRINVGNLKPLNLSINIFAYLGKLVTRVKVTESGKHPGLLRLRSGVD